MTKVVFDLFSVQHTNLQHKNGIPECFQSLRSREGRGPNSRDEVTYLPPTSLLSKAHPKGHVILHDRLVIYPLSIAFMIDWLGSSHKVQVRVRVRVEVRVEVRVKVRVRYGWCRSWT